MCVDLEVVVGEFFCSFSSTMHHIFSTHPHSLGPGQHTQYSLKSLPQLTHTIVSVALGQDHTLALTKLGEVLSWGLNRFSQLGYVVESSSSSTARHEEQIQFTPKKIYGPLRKEVVRGVAASKCASACWTEGEVFTWGTNNGQLGVYIMSYRPFEPAAYAFERV